MTRQFIDLSIYLENEVLSDPPPLAPKITYMNHVLSKCAVSSMD